ncbi:heparan-alpha-glucosaminide N-acetyltransferase domain-containing protein [uncultured Methanoregula sp.]|uniref:acyltransferase family protein n=1 Tax=uncultured Methanoregula sp. TaxID=1005933 RepID=UPI002AAA6787|nr:heparan-alpha-glucosaminide N-acetyltransferase domain-containing protein [uncultured Methanoregula sp.]
MSSPRLTSLDAFRGLAIILMILVNYPGNENYTFLQLEHTPWLGCTLADLAFPFFIFIVGAAVPLSIARRRERGESDKMILSHAIKRAALLFFIGFIANIFEMKAFGDYFVLFGVLQRIALVYLAVVLIILCLPRFRSRILLAFGLLALSLLLLAAVPAIDSLQNHEPIHLPITPERQHNLFDMTDTTIADVLYYRSAADMPAIHDPESLVSTFAAIVTGLLGVFGITLVKSSGVPEERKPVLLAGTGVFLVMGGLLFQLVIPLSEQLWTPSFVLFSGGCAFLMFSLFFWAMEIKGWRHWACLLVSLGKNALFIYLLAYLLLCAMAPLVSLPVQGGEVLTLRDFLYWRFIVPSAAPVFGYEVASLIYTVFALALLSIVALWMDRKKIFVIL